MQILKIDFNDRSKREQPLSSLKVSEGESFKGL